MTLRCMLHPLSASMLDKHAAGCYLHVTCSWRLPACSDCSSTQYSASGHKPHAMSYGMTVLTQQSQQTAHSLTPKTAHLLCVEGLECHNVPLQEVPLAGVVVNHLQAHAQQAVRGTCFTQQKIVILGSPASASGRWSAATRYPVVWGP
jgi:hypothetical protein